MSGLTDYVAEVLTAAISANPDDSDFVIHQGDDDLVYVSPESGTLYLISVKEAKAVMRVRVTVK